MVEMVAAPLPTLPSMVGSNPTFNNTLWDPQTVVLSMGVLYNRYMYVCKLPCDTEFFPSLGVVFKKKQSTVIVQGKR